LSTGLSGVTVIAGTNARGTLRALFL